MNEKTTGTMRRLGDVLIDAERVNPIQLEHALDVSKSRGTRLGETLIELGFIEEDELASALAERLEIELVDLSMADALDPESIRLVPEELALTHRVVVIGVENTDGATQLLLAMSDPTDQLVLQKIKDVSGFAVRPSVATESQINAALDSAYKELPRPLDEVTAELRRDTERELERTHIPSTQRPGERDKSAPAVRYIESLLYAALQRHASDIHVEPREFTTNVRFRIDGQLRNMPAPPPGYRDEVIARLKLLAELDVAEHRKPQSGSLSIRFAGRSVDSRVSTMPGVTGEKVVVRLLDRSLTRLRLDTLGFEEESVARMRNLIHAPHGIFLLCGPTGCGKTTTMYSFLRELDRHASNIVTVEDPVEYHLPGIHQINVKPNIGLDYAECLRTLLRQDPDVLILGEVRDLETLQVAVRASLTGHPVFSTLHTNTAISSVTRMANMGLEHYLIAATLNAALSQQLIRRVCPHCGQKRTPGKNERADLKRFFGREVDFDIAVTKGCDACDYTGYLGRVAVEELFVVDDDIRPMISDHANEAQLGEVARKSGMKLLIDHAFEKLRDGTTTVEEVLSLGFHQIERDE
ncbi:MAG: Flp pilus assembly complex ATPase component TadA [Planctomycetes bacterium]|nr:Flp pilus assembly complex ATPase component TadA [Planctomycetota bacterium]